MKSYDFVFSVFYISFVFTVNHVKALESEEIINGELVRDATYHAAICGVKFDQDDVELLGSGALIADEYVLSAAHLIVDKSNLLGRYILKPKVFYVHLGSTILNDGAGELIHVEKFFLMNYNDTSGENDLILIKLGLIISIRPRWRPLHVSTADSNSRETEGVVSSYGMHSTEIPPDATLRSAEANIIDSTNCDNTAVTDTPHRCIKMRNDNSGNPRVLCKFDGGAPFVVQNNYHLLAIARKPKENCINTERGSLFTDVRPFELRIRTLMEDNYPHLDVQLGIASQMIRNYPRRRSLCVIC